MKYKINLLIPELNIYDKQLLIPTNYSIFNDINEKKDANYTQDKNYRENLPSVIDSLKEYIEEVKYNKKFNNDNGKININNKYKQYLLNYIENYSSNIHQ